MSFDKTLSLARLRWQIQHCTKCDLAKHRKRSVPDNGNFHSTVMAVGEAPGSIENSTGYPFVGPSGQFLRSKMSSIGMDFDSMFITNVCKCYPPNCRTPTYIEQSACRGYLIHQVAAIHPKLIVVIGGTALNAFVKMSRITSAVGKLIKDVPFGSLLVDVFPIYHPAFICRRQKSIPEYLRQLELLATII